MAGVSGGVYSTELWIDREIGIEDFLHAFEKRFPNGHGRAVPLVEDPPGHKGQQLLEVLVPLADKDEIVPFMEEYSRCRGIDLRKFPRGTHPRLGD